MGNGTTSLGLRGFLGRALSTTGLHRPLLGNTGVVVAFHRVTDALPEDGLTRSSKNFERFCVAFREYFDVVPLSEIVSSLEQGRSLGGKLAITFDDGYLDNYEVAAPILQRLSLPATVFVVSQFMGTRTLAWWDRGLSPQPAWMNWDQVRELSRSGFDIGAHTHTHVDLGVVSGAEAQQEIVGSREVLTAQVGVVPQHFAFPYGQRNNLLESNRELIRAAGFRSCVACYGGTTAPGTDPLRLMRVPINLWYRTPEQFMLEVVARRA